MKVGALLVIASLLTAHATDYTNFARAFSFGSSNGAHPYANLIEASDGRLYGTTAYGGLTNDAFPNGMGTILGLNTITSAQTRLTAPIHTANSSKAGSEHCTEPRGTEGSSAKARCSN